MNIERSIRELMGTFCEEFAIGLVVIATSLLRDNLVTLHLPTLATTPTKHIVIDLCAGASNTGDAAIGVISTHLLTYSIGA